jgi:hypothetical protein
MTTGVVPTEHSGEKQTTGISPKARVSCMTSVELSDCLKIGGSGSLAVLSRKLMPPSMPRLAMGKGTEGAEQTTSPSAAQAPRRPWPRLRPGHLAGDSMTLHPPYPEVGGLWTCCCPSIDASSVLPPTTALLQTDLLSAISSTFESRNSTGLLSSFLCLTAAAETAITRV